MVRFGLDRLVEDFPTLLENRRLGVLCHAASITSEYLHITDVLKNIGGCTIRAVFGPQHGLFGQTQDNMVEWEGGGEGSDSGTAIYSLYGRHRKPSVAMLDGIDLFIVDLQDVGARPYTYIWTLKLCMEACLEQGIDVVVLDRPNPVGCLDFDGPVLNPDYFTFVGGAQIPLCHRMTIGEIAMLLQRTFFPSLELNIVWMEGWWRNSLWRETGLPWVLPSPNMPSPETAVVYPGMVLLEATNLSEGRGTTRPFELFGAPYLDRSFRARLEEAALLPGCLFREHGFIPAFQKWHGSFCYGLQLHVTEPRKFLPVLTTAAIVSAALRTGNNEFRFNDPPYEYETVKLPFDILAGSDQMRKQLIDGMDIREMRILWEKEYGPFRELFASVAHYPEERP